MALVLSLSLSLSLPLPRALGGGWLACWAIYRRSRHVHDHHVRKKKRDKSELPLEPEFTRRLGLSTQDAPYSVPRPLLQMAEGKAKPVKLGDSECCRREWEGSGSMGQTSDRESEQKAKGRNTCDLGRDTGS